MTTDGDTLLRAILAHPEADDPRLLFADWLDEQQAEPNPRAEFVRVQVEFALLDRRPVGDGSVRRRIRVGHRAKVLLEQGWRAWAGPAAALVPDGARFADHLTFRRGFIEEVTCTAADWLAHGDLIRRAHPVTRVVLTSVPAIREIRRGRTAYGNGLVRLGLEGDLDPGRAWPLEVVLEAQVPFEYAGNQRAARELAVLSLRWPGVAFEPPPAAG